MADDSNTIERSNIENHGHAFQISSELDRDDSNLEALRVSAPSTPNEVLMRCRVLLDELQKFADYSEQKKDKTEYRQKCEYNHFRNDIKQEAEQMEKVVDITTSQLGQRISQLITASNLSFWEALWDAAKRTSQIVVLRRHGSPIDIVSESGLKWIKVSTITERRLIMEMAKQGWDWAGDSDEESAAEECGEFNGTDHLEDIDISIVKMAVNLRKLAQDTRIRYRRPKVHFVLTRVSRGNKDIDKILDHIRATGATVETADQLVVPSPIEDVLEDMVMDEFKNFSHTINVDCTLLLACVSDISHGHVEEENWFNKDIRRQITAEEKEQLMRRLLWPAMNGHDLVCTKLAAQRMHEIVETIGTKIERERTALLMGSDATKSSTELLNEFQKLSQHPVPSTWHLPIKIVDEDSLENTAGSALALKAVGDLTDINRSVFLYGWLSGYTTISSNRVAAKGVERGVEAHRTSDEDVGPDIWICPTARSLVAKEKGRKDTHHAEE